MTLFLYTKEQNKDYILNKYVQLSSLGNSKYTYWSLVQPIHTEKALLNEKTSNFKFLS